MLLAYCDYLCSSPSVRSWREMLRTRQGLVSMRSACRNRIHDLLAKEGLIVPMSDLFGKKGRRWLAAQGLSAPHRQLVDLLSKQVGRITQAITEIEENLRHALGDHPVFARLTTVPGFGLLSAAAFLAEVGDVERFQEPGTWSRTWALLPGYAPRVGTCGSAASPRRDLL